jgi:hypothetical protein
MKRRTPQEKKRASYLRDRRNQYGENDKSSRRGIRLRKRLRSRGERRLAQSAFVSGATEVDLDLAEAVEGRLMRKRRGAWRKPPDTPLGEAPGRTFAGRAETGILDPRVADATLARIQAVIRGVVDDE